LVVRVGGMLADGTAAQSMRLVIAEIVMLCLMLLGALLQANHSRQLEESPAA
jgi:hypothetical protein